MCDVSRADDDNFADRSVGAFEVRPVLNAVDQVSSQLRELILTGALPPGTKLPTEERIAQRFGVSRATVRESLRTLNAQSLVRTVRGGGGGTFVTRPSIDNVSTAFGASLVMLAESNSVSFDELLEVRLLLEVQAARRAAEHADSTADLEKTLQSATKDPIVQTRLDREFHSQVLSLSGNRLLYVCAQPVFAVLTQLIDPFARTPGMSASIHAAHTRIAQAIAARDPDMAAEAMGKHLEHLRPTYQEAWRKARERRDETTEKFT